MKSKSKRSIKEIIFSPIGIFLSRIFRAIHVFSYDISVKIHEKLPKRKSSMGKMRRRELIFYTAFITLPFIQFCIFYVGVNTNSILMAFQRYDYSTGTYLWNGIENFKRFIGDVTLSGSQLSFSLRNSLILYAVNVIIGMPTSIITSYYVYKKMKGYDFFKVILFLPGILSSLVIVILFKYFVERGVPEVARLLTGKEILGPLSDPNTRFPMIVFYGVWVGFGGGMLLYAGAMSRIPASVIEYARIDGINSIQELWHITLPLIYPTISVFLVVGISGIFSSQANLYSFYGDSLPNNNMSTIGYFLFRKVIGAGSGFGEYPYASAAGLIFTAIAVPLTMAARWALEKFGPSTEY